MNKRELVCLETLESFVAKSLAFAAACWFAKHTCCKRMKTFTHSSVFDHHEPTMGDRSRGGNPDLNPKSRPGFLNPGASRLSGFGEPRPPWPVGILVRIFETNRDKTRLEKSRKSRKSRKSWKSWSRGSGGSRGSQESRGSREMLRYLNFYRFVLTSPRYSIN